MKNRLMESLFGMIVLAFSAVVLAQTGQQPGAAGSKTIPRTPDGTPDLSGTWAGGGGGTSAPMELTPWGMDKFIWNKEPAAPMTGGGQRLAEDPSYHCYPAGMVRLGPPIDIPGVFSRNLIQIHLTPGKVIVLYQFNHEVRQIFTDGREHPSDLGATWNGHSIGRWDGDAFVVDTIGLRDETWLDSQGHEHSTDLHVVERYRRVDPNTLEVERTLTDPKALAKPYTTRAVLKLRADFDIGENVGGTQNDCDLYLVRKRFFGEHSLLGISDHP